MGARKSARSRVVVLERVTQMILLIRGHKVMLDEDLAALYEVEVKAITDMKRKYLYGGQPAEAEPAAGIKGTIIRVLDGTLMFRVYYNNERFTDYAIRHDDLSVTIDKDAMATFYKACPAQAGMATSTSSTIVRGCWG